MATVIAPGISSIFRSIRSGLSRGVDRVFRQSNGGVIVSPMVGILIREFWKEDISRDELGVFGFTAAVLAFVAVGVGVVIGHLMDGSK